MKTVALIYGGESGEHDVSCVSAGYLEQTIAAAGFTAVPVYISRKGEWHRQPRVATLAAENVQNPSSLLQKNGRVVLTSATEETAIDFAFPIVHGTAGEDGSLQGFFEVLGLAYAGSGVATSAVCMDKALMRALFAVNQIPQVEYFVIADAESADSEKIHARIESSFGYPVFIKPCNMGSSVGVHKVSGRDALAKAIRDAAVKAGICRADVALTGPQLLMLCDDMATALRPNDQSHRGAQGSSRGSGGLTGSAAD